MLTVREAMKTGGLSKCRLLAGEAGLDNAITCVDCMEVPNIEACDHEQYIGIKEYAVV